jgi:hypothetical protein
VPTAIPTSQPTATPKPQPQPTPKPTATPKPCAVNCNPWGYNLHQWPLHLQRSLRFLRLFRVHWQLLEWQRLRHGVRGWHVQQVGWNSRVLLLSRRQLATTSCAVISVPSASILAFRPPFR